MGADAVLVNTAIAVADDPVAMARAFRMADRCRITGASGRTGKQQYAGRHHPLTGFLEALA